VILKTVETCNINCSYCYFYVDTEKQDRQISKNNKKIIRPCTVENLIKFLKEGIDSLRIDLLKIVFHGGEPLLQNRSDFDAMCARFVNEFSKNLTLEFGIQTNGICINSHWLELFSKYKISPGISVDGPEKFNDMYRKDFSGRGTYQKVVKAIRKVQKFIDLKKVDGVSTITVVNARCSAKELFYHLAHDLKINAMSFLLPDYNHDSFMIHNQETGLSIEDYGVFMCELFDAWIENNDDAVDIVFFRQIVSLLMGSKQILMADTGPFLEDDELPILTVYHDGSITPDDTYMTTDKAINYKKMTIENSTLKEFISSKEIRLLKEVRRNTPEACKTCKWLKICNGGASVNRYSKKNGFDNPSVYCEGLKIMYEHISKVLIKNGIPKDIIHEQMHETA
jgi:uncharacterized protein